MVGLVGKNNLKSMKFASSVLLIELLSKLRYTILTIIFPILIGEATW